MPTNNTQATASVAGNRTALSPRPATRHRGGDLLIVLLAAACLAMVACSGNADLPVTEGMGPDPALPPPDESFLPVVDIAPAVGWQAEATPTPATGLSVTAFARGLDHPRWILVLPNGDVLVAETNAPPRPQDGSGLRGWIMKRVMKRAGAAVPSANRITLLRDTDGDNQADVRSSFLEALHSPFGMALVGNDLYVANTDALVRFDYVPGTTRIDTSGEIVAELPAGPINHHWTKNVIASPDGSELFVTVGSNSNIAENGMENEVNRAAILRIDPASGETQLFASGLRNPNGLAWNPVTGELWTTVNERDELGHNLVPDYMTSVKEGGFYGWPYSYYGQHVDERVQPQRPELVSSAISPDFALGSHTASIGLTFYEDELLPQRYRGGAFVGQHGSWNRKPLSGYKVIFVPFENGKPQGKPVDILTGFVNEDGEAHGRPVGVAVDGSGALLVADDVGNVIWRIAPAGETRTVSDGF
jgi:glucose/arabinose dehydrogenase